MRNNFLLFCLVIFASQALADEEDNVEDSIANQCKSEAGISQELVEKGKKVPSAKDPKIKEFILCYLKKKRIISESGDFDRCEIKKHLTINFDKEVEKYISKCFVKKDTPEDSAFEAAKCVVQNPCSCGNKASQLG